MEDTLKMIISDFRKCNREEKLKLCTECMANARIGFTKTPYCEFMREFGKQAMDDIIEVMERVL